jgi:HEAT repeat protein
LIGLLGDNSLAIRRDAATALGRIGRNEATPPLLAALRGSADRYLVHAIVLALIRIGNAAPLASALRDPDSSVRRGALLAMDQIDGSGLTPDQVVPLLDPGQPLLKEAALAAIARHPGWGDRTREFFRDALSRSIETPQREDLRQELVSFSGTPGVQELIATVLAASSWR